MESTVESLERVYNDLISAVAAAMQAHEPAPEETKALVDHASQQHHHPSSNQHNQRQSQSQSQSQTTTTEREAALERLKQSWELFKVACDRAEELLDSLRQRIGSECLVDEATGASAASSSASAVNSGPYAHHVVGIPPISAVKLEQMSKAVRWLVIDLQQGHAQAQAQAQAQVHAHAQALAHASSAPAEDAAQP